LVDIRKYQPQHPRISVPAFEDISRRVKRYQPLRSKISAAAPEDISHCVNRKAVQSAPSVREVFRAGMSSPMTDFLVAESAIRQLHARYTDAVWRKDYQSFGDCFTEDAEWRISGMVLRGREEIVQTIEHLMSRYRCVLVTLRTPILEVGRGTATGRTYLTEQSIKSDGQPFGLIGTYYERFVDQGDRWRFSWRLFQTHYMGSPDMSGSLFDNLDFGPPPAMPELDSLTYNHSQLAPNRGVK
jgi:hypothetical protein